MTLYVRCIMGVEKRPFPNTYCGYVFWGKLVGGVWDEQARFPHGTIANDNTLDGLHSSQVIQYLQDPKQRAIFPLQLSQRHIGGSMTEQVPSGQLTGYISERWPLPDVRIKTHPFRSHVQTQLGAKERNELRGRNVLTAWSSVANKSPSNDGHHCLRRTYMATVAVLDR